MDRRKFLGSGLVAAGVAATSVSAAGKGRRSAAQERFLWGTATAAHQVEGQNLNSDYWLLEQLEGSPFVDKSGDACDHYHRYPADIAMMAAAGLNAYRFSLEWARIEPEEGQFSLAVLDHYRSMLAECHEYGITPVVTFHHFTSPLWVAKAGGWTVQRTADRFARYCERAVAHLGDMIGVACTINELNFTSLLDAKDFIPVARRNAFMAKAGQAVCSDNFSSPPFGGAQATARTVISAHRQGYEALKAGPGDFRVGMTVSMSDFQAVNGGEAKRDAIRAVAEDQFFEAARGDDFVGVQAYTRERVGSEGLLGPEEGVPLTQMGYEVWPEATEACIRRAWNMTGCRIIVTESGIGTPDDAQRIAYIDENLAGVARARADGIPVDGYIHWTLIDNFEWTNGYEPKFGLVEVDRQTLRRTPKPSLAHLANYAKRGL